jgi:hypothetical protein
VRLALPAADGVPEITPVDPFRVNPAGNDPELIDHVSLPVPPAAARCAVYGAPTTPDGRVDVRTESGTGAELSTIAF